MDKLLDAITWTGKFSFYYNDDNFYECDMELIRLYTLGRCNRDKEEIYIVNNIKFVLESSDYVPLYLLNINRRSYPLNMTIKTDSEYNYRRIYYYHFVTSEGSDTEDYTPVFFCIPKNSLCWLYYSKIYSLPTVTMWKTPWFKEMELELSIIKYSLDYKDCVFIYTNNTLREYIDDDYIYQDEKYIHYIKN